MILMDYSALHTEAFEKLSQANDAASLAAVRTAYLGRKGALTGALKELKDLPLAKRRIVGPKLNALRHEFEEAISKKETELTSAARPGLDLTAPGARSKRGHLHPLTIVDREVRSIFRGMNFSVIDGPETESEYYNFDALNIPAGHPARDMWDTFWIAPESRGKALTTAAKKNAPVLLRTHTSPNQVRFMETHEPPLQIIVPGRCFRYEATDASHEVYFW